MERETGTQYVLSLSYGKDSMATIEACRLLGYPLDRIVTCEVWATDTINADLPPMVEFKAKADKIILERYGIEVEHICARNKDGSKKTYEQMFYHIPKRRTSKVTQPSEENGGGETYSGKPLGYPVQAGSWCKKLKVESLQRGIPTPNDWMVQKPQGDEHRPISTASQSAWGGNWCTALKTKADGLERNQRIPVDGETQMHKPQDRRVSVGSEWGGCQATSALKRDPLSASLSSRGYGATANSRRGQSTLF